MSKGSSPRPYSVSLKEFDNNFDRIFRKPDPREIEDARIEDEAFKQIPSIEQAMTSQTDELPNIGLNNTNPQCGCGRSPSGRCVGWHNLNDEQYKFMLGQYEIMKFIQPTHNPEQDWTVEERIAGTK
jgi:hypothetical protein